MTQSIVTVKQDPILTPFNTYKGPIMLYFKYTGTYVLPTYQNNYYYFLICFDLAFYSHFITIFVDFKNLDKDLHH